MNFFYKNLSLFNPFTVTEENYISSLRVTQYSSGCQNVDICAIFYPSMYK
jgi:hypothetical protein